MGHFEISFPGGLEGNIVIQESIFNLTELFSVTLEKVASPSSVTAPYSSLSLLFPLSQLYFFCSILFLLPAVSLVQGSVLEGRPRWVFSQFRKVWLPCHLQTICCQALDHQLLHPPQFYMYFQISLLFSPVNTYLLFSLQRYMLTSKLDFTPVRVPELQVLVLCNRVRVQAKHWFKNLYKKQLCPGICGLDLLSHTCPHSQVPACGNDFLVLFHIHFFHSKHMGTFNPFVSLKLGWYHMTDLASGL